MIEDVRIEHENNIYAKIICEDSIAQELADFFTFSVPGANFSPLYRERKWDGKIRLFSTKTRQIYVGLIEYVVKFCEINGYSSLRVTHQKSNGIIKTPSVNDIKNWNIPEKYTPRDYQLAAYIHALRNKRCNILSPTASGKSLIIYMITRWLLENGRKRGLLIVPTVSLVQQMAGDFVDYGWDAEANCQMIYEGKSKIPNKPFVISTWQSIYEMPKEYFALFDFVIGDEAHQFKAKSLTGILNKMINADYRIGTTGTLSGENVHKLVLEGLFGPVKRFATTKQLMDRKQLAELSIKCLVLKYPEEVSKSLRGFEYKDEIDFLIGYKPRNVFIRNLAESLKGNTLLLYTRVDDHGKILFDLFKETIKDRKVFFISGQVSADVREEVRHIVEKETDAIIIASFGTFSTGTNIRNLHNVIFGSPTKSRIRTMQSIGRGLRIGDNHTESTLYDIADDLRYKSYVNFTLNHYEDRVRMYSAEQFKFKTFNIGIS